MVARSVLTLVLICLLSCAASFKVRGLTYYVKPDADTPCPHQPCETLTYYANNVADFFTTNTTFVFFKGTHLFRINRLLLVGNISGLTLRGNGSLISGPHGLLEPSTKIQCQGVYWIQLHKYNKLLCLPLLAVGLHLVPNIVLLCYFFQ